MKVLIIEDEPRAATRLEKLIKEYDNEIEIVEVIESVKDGIEYLSKSNDLSLIFSDIHLTDSLSFDIFKEVDVSVPVIFTTAYDQYAIDAFKTNGIDYLLKPIDQEAFDRSMKKFEKLTKSVVPDMIHSLAEMLSDKRSQTTEYKQRFMVKVGSHIKSIVISDVLAFYSKDKSTFLFTNGFRSYVLESSLDNLEPLLDPNMFFRINRHFIVSDDAVEDIVAYSNSRLKIIVKGMEDELIIVSRNRTKSYKAWLGE